MNKDLLSSEEMKHFIDDVKDQIQYKPIRTEVEEELKAHIEDRTMEYIDMGIEEKEASHKAIEQMGDAISIGIMMNETRHVKNYRPLFYMLLVAVFIGIIGNFGTYRVNFEDGILAVVDVAIFNLYYFVWGLIIFTVIYYKGYTFVVRHSKLLLMGFFVLCFSERLYGILSIYLFHRFHSGHVIGFSWLLLFGPILAVAMYRWRRNGYKAIALYDTLLIAMILLLYKTSRGFVLTAVAVLLITSMVTMFYLIQKGYMLGQKKKLFTCSLVGFLAVISIYGAVSFTDQKTNIGLFFAPEKQATDHWKDGYNGVLMKRLLSTANLFGPMELSKEELMNYGTGAWYFEEEEVAEITHYLHYDESTVSLEEILPQHYHNNYRFAYWILKYGYLPGVLPILMVISLFGIMFVVTGKIRNKLGHTLALTCSVCLSSQMLLYLLGNLGYQYASFSTLPFISEGLCSITTNMILVGCVLSAYRYDRVIREEKYLNTVIKV
jgi:hypothetical protein